MFSGPPLRFPVRVDDPASCSAGSLHVADLVAEGPNVGYRLLGRAVCALAREYHDATLGTVKLADWRTAFVGYTDELVCQFELVYADEPLDRDSLERLTECRHRDVDQLVVASTTRIAPEGRSFSDHAGVDVLQMDADRGANAGPWRRYKKHSR